MNDFLPNSLHPISIFSVCQKCLCRVRVSERERKRERENIEWESQKKTSLKYDFLFFTLYYVSLSLPSFFYAFFISKTFAFHLDGFSSLLAQFTQNLCCCWLLLCLDRFANERERNEIQIERREWKKYWESESENDIVKLVTLSLSLSNRDDTVHMP